MTFDAVATFDDIAENQGGKASKVNQLVAAASPAMPFSMRYSTTIALTLGYNGGHVYVDGVRTDFSAGTLALSNNTVNYIQASRALAITKTTGSFDADKLPVYKITTSGGAITVIEDFRDLRQIDRFFNAHFVQAMADANKTITAEQSLASSIETTGALTALRDLIVPAVRRSYLIFANVTGGFGVRVKTSGGTGITVADAKWATLHCDGTNVVRITADT